MADSDKIKLASNTSQKDIETNRILDQGFSEASEYLNRKRQNWEEYEDAYEGRQWKGPQKGRLKTLSFS